MPNRPNPHSRGKPIQVSLRPDSELDEELARRMDTRGRPSILKRDAQRYYRLIRRRREQLSHRYPAERILAINDALSEAYLTPGILRSYFIDLVDLDDTDELAILDAIEQARSASWPDPRQSTRERLEALGLIRTA